MIKDEPKGIKLIIMLKVSFLYFIYVKRYVTNSK